jgi:hypothetical protein
MLSDHLEEARSWDCKVAPTECGRWLALHSSSAGSSGPTAESIPEASLSLEDQVAVLRSGIAVVGHSAGGCRKSRGRTLVVGSLHERGLDM